MEIEGIGAIGRGVLEQLECGVWPVASLHMPIIKRQINCRLPGEPAIVVSNWSCALGLREALTAVEWEPDKTLGQNGDKC